MGRSNTLPVAEPRNSQSSKAPITRSATTSVQTPTSGSHHYIKTPFSNRKHNAPDTAITTGAPCPSAPTRQNSVQTRYIDMLLAMDTIPRLHNILSSFFTWILLAGFIIFPGTFTTIANLDNNSQIQDNHTASTILASVKNIPLLVIAGVCSGIGTGGMVWLWWVWRQNYVWLLNKVFLCAAPLHHMMSRTNSVSSQTRLPQLLRRSHLNPHQRLHPTKRHLVRDG
jgi:hypothetical protein